MNPKDFARHLASWMPPGILARASGDWRNPPGGHEITSLRFETSILKNASDARFDWFVRQFLDNITIPEELILYTHGLYAQHVTREAANWLRGFKFSGDLHFDPDCRPESPGRKVLLAISAPLCEVRVIWPPIHMLNNLISNLADYWRHVASKWRPQQVHHEPTGEWPFQVWVDLQVARACGFQAIGRAGMIPSINQIESVRNHASIAGKLPDSAEELAIAAGMVKLRHQTQSRGFGLYHSIRGE